MEILIMILILHTNRGGVPNGEYTHIKNIVKLLSFMMGIVFQNLIDVDWGCYYTDAKAEIHVLLDMQNETDSWFGFEIRNMSRDYDYVVNGTFTEDSNEIGNFNYGPIPNAGAGSTHTNWVSQFFPQPEKEYCIEAVLSEKWIHDPFAPWENSRSEITVSHLMAIKPMKTTLEIRVLQVQKSSQISH